MKRLTVYLNGERIGALDEDDSGLLEFRYAPEWTARSDAIPLSRSLPLRAEPFRGKHARPFFAGILPDDSPRQQVAAILGISERNDFAMLEQISGECAGAVSLLPEVVRPAYVWDMRLAPDGERDTAELYRARVRSVRRYTYEEVQQLIDGGDAEETLLLLKDVGEHRIRRESERGGASLPMPEQEVHVDDDGTYSLQFRPLLPVEDWNAQISLLTGIVAAQIMLDGKRGVAQSVCYDAFDKGIGLEAHAMTGPARPGSLVPSEMPGIIVEGLFLSNEEDAAFIVSEAAAPALVTAYEQAILEYFAEPAS